MHIPVLLQEVLQYLEVKPDQVVVDGTANGGGHTKALAEIIGNSGKIIAIEIDLELASSLMAKIEEWGIGNKVTVINDSYAHMEGVLSRLGISKVDTVLLDLGMSSWHIENSGRGFTFDEHKNEPLDMRFNPSMDRESASNFINSAPEAEIERILREYGEEGFSRQIAASIIRNRQVEPITMTGQFLSVIKRATPRWYQNKRLHYATKTFQSIRIAVNDELKVVETGLEAATRVLKSGGRLAVITFHSHEDRIVKKFIKEKVKESILIQDYKKPIVASRAEIITNPRSRSAKLRISKKS